MSAIKSLVIEPILHPLQASVCLPGSKSHTNRALLISALAEGTSCLRNALFSDDSRYFAGALSDLGFEVLLEPEQAAIRVAGLGGRIPVGQAELFTGNAGTAARFLTAFLTLGYGEYLLDGDARMRERPLGDLLEALSQLGADLEAPTNCPPVRIRASGLPGGSTGIPGNVSSQYLSALLMVAPYAQGPVEIDVTSALFSKPYVDLTISTMQDFGVPVSRDGYQRFSVRPGIYQSQSSYLIETDASAASYFFAAPAVLGGTVRVEHISLRSRQGDIAFLEVLREMGCSVLERRGGVEVTGPETLQGVTVDMRDIPDTAQTLAAIAPFASSPTRIYGIASARVKETDRVAAVCAQLARLGVSVEEHQDGLTIQPCREIRPACIRTYKDHRMAMSFSLTGLRVPGIRIEDPDCVSKTFPNYFDVLGGLNKGRMV
ncbi:MAG: 3-phosphoshikimate 1-carboxyvinyltransferase [Anaerolineales bacterium]|nr:3-phosphoshikimate 1-carboxyvinyltransferase [Anaerolineales bacterium]